MIDRDKDISDPSEGESKGLVLAISPSKATQNTLKDYLNDIGFSVALFDSVDSGNMFIRRYAIDAIIYDSNNSNYELVSLQQLLKTELVNTPVIMLTNGKGYTLQHPKVYEISMPINLTNLSNTLYQCTKSANTKYTKFIEFINQITNKVLELTPPDHIKETTQILDEGTKRFSLRNSSVLKRSSENLSLIIFSDETLNLSDLSILYSLTVEEMIEEIDNKLKSTWAKSLFIDAIESLLILGNVGPDDRELITLLQYLGVDAGRFVESIASIVPNLDEIDKSCVVFDILLSDLGPDLRTKVTNDETIANEFHQGIAGQILTLVGQGSEYHEGLFGPIPIPSSMDVTAIIYSRILNSAIKDQRMKGKTLNVIGIGFRRDLINHLPDRKGQEEIFLPYKSVINENEISDEILNQILNNFSLKLK
ncbi:MAG: hypothetical protein INQ03_02135 [Candidatus Heimdallarchaeota archaeon]|nr:hypothetical protein [Candidatus Heimdallarchaeota archaeon]